MIDRTYRCDLCRDSYPANEMIGLHWQSWPKGWVEKPAREVENHICAPCLSTLQHFPDRCGQGFECSGGPNCGSDHK